MIEELGNNQPSHQDDWFQEDWNVMILNNQQSYCILWRMHETKIKKEAGKQKEEEKRSRIKPGG